MPTHVEIEMPEEPLPYLGIASFGHQFIMPDMGMPEHLEHLG